MGRTQFRTLIIPLHLLLEVCPFALGLFGDGTVMITRLQEQGENRSPGLQHIRRLAMDDHIIGHRGGTGGCKRSPSFDLHHTDAAGPGRSCSLEMTKGGNEDTVAPSHFKDGLTGGVCQFPPVYGDEVLRHLPSLVLLIL